MAKVHVNDKGFKIIECSLVEIVNIGGYGICDSCNRPDFKGYYIAALNQWYCTECFTEWFDDAINYPEDRSIEKRNFERYSRLLNV